MVFTASIRERAMEGARFARNAVFFFRNFRNHFYHRLVRAAPPFPKNFNFFPRVLESRTKKKGSRADAELPKRSNSFYERTGARAKLGYAN